MNPDGTDPNTPPADINYNKDVAGKPLDDILADRQAEINKTVIDDTSEPGVPPVPPTPPVDPNQPATPPASTEPVTPPTTPPPSDTVEGKKADAEALKTQLKDELKDEISEETAKKVVKFLGVETAEGDENKPPWEKENRNPTYEEAINWAMTQAQPELVNKVTEQVKEELKKEAEEEEKKQQEEVEKTKQLEDQRTEQWTNVWNNQFGELEGKGLIPKVVQENVQLDEKGLPLDPGKRARYEIFQTMQQVSAERTGQGGAPLMSVIEAYFMHHKPSSTQPAGENAPVFGANKGVGTADSGQFTHSQVQGASFESILAEIAKQRSQRG